MSFPSPITPFYPRSFAHFESDRESDLEMHFVLIFVLSPMSQSRKHPRHSAELMTL